MSILIYILFFLLVGLTALCVKILFLHFEKHILWQPAILLFLREVLWFTSLSALLFSFLKKGISPLPPMVLFILTLTGYSILNPFPPTQPEIYNYNWPTPYFYSITPKESLYLGEEMAFLVVYNKDIQDPKLTIPFPQNLQAEFFTESGYSSVYSPYIKLPEIIQRWIKNSVQVLTKWETKYSTSILDYIIILGAFYFFLFSLFAVNRILGYRLLTLSIYMIIILYMPTFYLKAENISLNAANFIQLSKWKDYFFPSFLTFLGLVLILLYLITRKKHE